MKQPSAPQGLEPIQTVDQIQIARRPLGRGIRLNIQGRRITLRGIRTPPTGILRWLVILGPGLIAASAGNDAGGIATYSAAGARYGYDLIWVMVIITVSLAVVQEMAARLGAASGRGLLDLIRERYGIGWATLAIVTLLIANLGLVVSEFVAIGAAAELLGVSKLVVVPLAAGLLWVLVVRTSYQRIEKIFLLMTLVFFAYPIAAILARPDWGAVARGAFVPSLHLEAGYLVMVVGLMGTTITPFMQLFEQSSTVERGVARRHYGPERLDVYIGSVFSNLMSIAMIIATAAALHFAGQPELTSAAEAARALEPALGKAAGVLFAIGLLGASMLAAAVLPLATAYALSEAAGRPKGVNLDFRRARLFFGLFTAMLAFGALCALIPGLPVIQLLLLMQVLNGMLLPIILIFLLLLVNDPRLMGTLANSRRDNILAWGTFALITTAVIAMLALQALNWLGI